MVYHLIAPSAADLSIVLFIAINLPQPNNKKIAEGLEYGNNQLYTMLV